MPTVASKSLGKEEEVYETHIIKLLSWDPRNSTYNRDNDTALDKVTTDCLIAKVNDSVEFLSKYSKIWHWVISSALKLPTPLPSFQVLQSFSSLCAFSLSVSFFYLLAGHGCVPQLHDWISFKWYKAPFAHLLRFGKWPWAHAIPMTESWWLYKERETGYRGEVHLASIVTWDTLGHPRQSLHIAVCTLYLPNHNPT